MFSPLEEYRKKLYEDLSDLSERDLYKLLAILDVPRDHIPGKGSSTGDLVGALWDWTTRKKGCGLEKLREVLDKVSNEGNSPNRNEEADDSSDDKNSPSLNLIEHLTSDIPPDSPFYIARREDTYWHKLITKKKVLIRLESQGPKWGKSSLLVRILNYAQNEHNYHTFRLSLDIEYEPELHESTEFFKWFCRNVTYSLKKPDLVEQFWEAPGVNTDKCTWYFEEHLLEQIDRPLVLGLDSAAKLFQVLNASKVPVIAQQFFSMLRKWHERATDSENWQKLRLIIARSLSIQIKLLPNQSPFNIGTPVQLEEFEESQIRNLALKYGLKWSLEEAAQLMSVVGGQPYLVQTALYRIYHNTLTLGSLKEGLSEGSNLDTTFLNLLYEKLEGTQLRRAFEEIISNKVPTVLNSSPHRELCDMGLTKLVATPTGITHVVPLCDLYRRYFYSFMRNDR